MYHGNYIREIKSVGSEGNLCASLLTYKGKQRQNLLDLLPWLACGEKLFRLLLMNGWMSFFLPVLASYQYADEVAAKVPFSQAFLRSAQMA